MKKYKMEEMMPNEFLDAIEQMPVVFVPTGLIEWHGDHLPLGQDALKAHGICLSIAKEIDGGIVLPPNYYGRPGYSRYAGTMTFSEACMDLLFTELFGQLKKLGARIVVVLTGHYGPCQVNFIKRVSEYFIKEHPDMKIIAQPEYEDITIDGEVPADHAGKWETSIFWNMYPELTEMNNFSMDTSIKKIYCDPPNDFYKEEANWEWNDDLSKTASPELGKKCVEIIADHLAGKIRNLLNEINCKNGDNIEK